MEHPDFERKGIYEYVNEEAVRTFIIFSIIKWMMPVGVSEIEEMERLDTSEHSEAVYPLFGDRE